MPASDDDLRLANLFDRYPPPIATLGKEARAWLSARFPGLVEIVYLYERQQALVLAWSPSERGVEAAVSLSVRPDRVALYLNGGDRLPDPERRLKGRGNGVRHVELGSAAELDRPEVETWIVAALDLAGVRPEPGAASRIVFKVESQARRAARAVRPPPASA